MARHMRKNTVSDFFGSGVFGLLGSFPIPQRCKILQAAPPADALMFCVLTHIETVALC